MTARVERFEALEWIHHVFQSTWIASAGDAFLLAGDDHGVFHAQTSLCSENRYTPELPDLPTAKRAAWDLLLELRAKTDAPALRIADLPAPRALSPEETAAAVAEGRALRESLDSATVGMEGVTCDQFAAMLAGKPPIYLTQQPDPRDAELAKLRAIVAKVASEARAHLDESKRALWPGEGEAAHKAATTVHKQAGVRLTKMLGEYAEGGTR